MCIIPQLDTIHTYHMHRRYDFMGDVGANRPRDPNSVTTKCMDVKE